MLLRNWVYTLLLVFIFGAITREPWPVAFSVAAAIVLAVTVQWRRHALDSVRYRRHWTYRRGFPGEQISVRIEVDNQKLLPISWLRVIDNWPQSTGPTDTSILRASHMPDMGELINLYSLRWYQRIERYYELTLRQRGAFLVGPAEAFSGDLFGMYETSRVIDVEDKVVVFPELLPLNTFHPPTQDPFGGRRSVRRLFDDPCQTMAIRPYQPEDGFRRIHWPATARTGELQAKVFQPVSARVMMICLNVSTQPQFWLGVEQDKLEYLIKVAATLAYQGIQDGYAVGLLSNGCLAHSDQPFHIPPGRSTEHLAQLLTALAGVTPFTIAAFEKYLALAMPKVPYGASLAVISALISPALSDSLMRLNRYRTQTTLFTLDSEAPPVIPGVRTIQMEITR